jgi:adenosylhomocysteine nucleosidase
MAKFRCVSADASNRWYEAQIGSAEVRVVITGTGRFAAQRAMNSALGQIPDFCIASGLAGALKPDYLPGRVLAARYVTEIQSGRTLPGDSELLRLAAETGATLVERFLVAERVIATVEEKRKLAASGDAVEMEGAYVLAAAAQKGIRAGAVRSVSDAVDRDLPLDFDAVFDEDGRTKVFQVLAQIVSKPGRIPGLVRLADESGRAASALASFLNAYVQVLPTSPERIATADAIAR